MMKKTLSLVMSCALLPSAVHAAQFDDAAAYPARPIRIVVPQSPGASTDLTARLIGLKLSEAFGQSVIVDNRPGAGSINGTEVVARATPDGHTLLVVASSFTINPSLQKNLPYDTVRDFAPITQVSRFPNLLAAHPAVPVTTLQDVIALAKSKPGQLNYASAGLGTGTHMSAELLKMMTGIDFVHIPFKGGGPAVIAIIGGQTQLIFGTTVGLLPHVRSGKLKAIAVTTAKRSPAAPEIPSFAESGLPGYDHGPWNGLFAPGKTPQAIVDKLNAATVRALRSAEVTRIFTNEGADPVGNKPAEFAAIVKEETAKWARVIKAAGIKPE
jgi:tripartite-type tricarboxylate transporter receptor subunit TctC